MEKHEISKEKLENVENENNLTPEEIKANEYQRRRGVIYSLYPDINARPESVEEEDRALSTLISCLTSKGNGWGKRLASDHVMVDGFYFEKYEEAFGRLAELQEENKKYISKEQEESFEFPNIDFDELLETRGNLKTKGEAEELFHKVDEITSQPLPLDVNRKLKGLQNELFEDEMLHLPEDDIARDESQEKMQMIGESKYASIYGKIRSKVAQMFTKVKSLIKSKDKDKEIDNDKEQDL